MLMKFLRWLFRLLGILLLISVIPRRDPWSSANIWTSGEIYHNVTVRLAILGWRLSTSGVYIFLLVLLGLALLIGASPSARKSFVDLIRSRRRLIPLVVPLAIFLLALYPTRSGLPMVLYLALSVLGLLFTLFGIYPALIWLRRWPPVELLHARAWKPISKAFYSIRPRYFMILVFAITFALTNICCYFIFDHVPHIQDNIVQLFHAKIFLSGHLTAPSHEHKEFFDFIFNINNGRWYSEYPPAHTFMIMLGLIIGAPWVVNPLLGSASIVLFYLIGKELYDEKTGRLAALLGILSPFIIFMSSTFFSNATSLFYTALFTLFFIKTIRTSKLYYPLIAGISIGVCLNARALTAIGVGLPYAFYAIYLLFTRKRDYLLRFAVMLMGFMLLVGVLAGFNYLTNGHPLLTGYEVLWGKGHLPGFGRSAWGPPHTPKRGLIHNLNNLNAMNKYLFEWCIPCTFFAMLFFMRGRQNRWDYLLISSTFSLSFVYFFYWFQAWEVVGPRYMYESTCALILFTAKGILDTPDIMRERFHVTSSKDQIRYLSNLVIAFCVVVAVFVNVPKLVTLYSNDYWGVNTKVQQAVKKEKISNAVVFVGSYYGSVLPLNSPMLDSEIIYAQNRESENKLMMDYYPDRRYYIARDSEVQEIFSHYYDSLETLAIPNADFEEGTLEGWSTSGDAWDITDRTDLSRWTREGQFHAESLVGGEHATGVLTSSKFKITERYIKLHLNGWNPDPLRPNQCFLKDAQTHEVLRTASPPEQDAFTARVWDVSDLIGREVYLMVVDGDDASARGGWAWMGIDSVTQMRCYDGEETLVIPNSDFEEATLNGWSFSGNAWDITDRTCSNREGEFHAESLVGGEGATGILMSSKFRIGGRFIKFLLSGWNRDPLRPNQCFLRDAGTHEILRTASPPNKDAFAPKFWDVSDLVGREVYLMVIDNDDNTLGTGERAWIGIDFVRQLQSASEAENAKMAD